MTPDDVIEIRGDGELLARCALWWRSTPQLHGRKAGYIGRYDRASALAARELLRIARARLAAAGCATVVAPVDGSTWERYRFVTGRGVEPAFALEPANPDEYPRDFEGAGFEPLAHYVSAEESDLDRYDERVTRAADRLFRAGVRIRQLDTGRLGEELDAIYDVACASFAQAFLFSPISRRDFHGLYEPLLPYLKRDFVRIAEHEGRAVGFAFGIPDFVAAQRGEIVDTIVGKTQAVLPDLRYAGLGAVMLDEVRVTARERGMRRIIHALIREGTTALNGSRRVAQIMRNYTLYESRLT